MGRPVGNGLIELVDEKSHDGGFFCMQLTAFIMKESKECGRSVADLWDERFREAKNGVCAYRGKCLVYAKTMTKRKRTGFQLSINFE